MLFNMHIIRGKVSTGPTIQTSLPLIHIRYLKKSNIPDSLLFVAVRAIKDIKPIYKTKQENKLYQQRWKGKTIKSVYI
jgi:hypothetical protein